MGDEDLTRLKALGLSALVLAIVIGAAGFETSWFGFGRGGTQTTLTSTSTETITQPARGVSVTTNGNVVYYTFDFCPLSGQSLPTGWSSVKNKAGWSVQNCSLEYTGNSTGYDGAFYSGKLFSNFTYSLTGIGLGYCPSNPTGSAGGQRPPVLAMTLRQQHTNQLNEYSFHLDSGKAQILKYVNGTSVVLASGTSSALDPLGRFSLSVTFSGDTMNASWSGPQVNGVIAQGTVSATDSSFASGYIGVSTYNCNAAFTDLAVSAPAG